MVRRVARAQSSSPVRSSSHRESLLIRAKLGEIVAASAVWDLAAENPPAVSNVVTASDSASGFPLFTTARAWRFRVASVSGCSGPASRKSADAAELSFGLVVAQGAHRRVWVVLDFSLVGKGVCIGPHATYQQFPQMRFSIGWVSRHSAAASEAFSCLHSLQVII